VLDAADNCPVNANSTQTNTDGDSLGDVCDSEDDGDGYPDSRGMGGHQLAGQLWKSHQHGAHIRMAWPADLQRRWRPADH
jgi:hypothetical protein